jgi:hypothetical protein
VGWIVAGITFLVLCLALGALSYVGATTTFRDSETYARQMHLCEDTAIKDAGLEGGHAGIDTLESISAHCFNRILYTDKLSESSITRGMYIHQRYENNVILFMVVLITLAGVALAGLQLITSYKLAAGGHALATAARQSAALAVPTGGVSPAVADAPPPAISPDVTELWIEQGRLTIRSSVTGLVVLTLSLAFFFIYVAMVYTIRVPPDPQAANSIDSSARPAATNSLLSVGANGPPPSD